MRKLPARFEPHLFDLLLTGATSLIVASVAVYSHVGWADGLVGLCIRTWLPAWGIVFPLAMIIAPGIKKVVSRCVEPEN